MPVPAESGPLAIRDPAAIAAAETAKARIQAQFLMALQKPREKDEARARILKLCKNPSFAGQLEYSKPIGRTAIKGISIRGAEMMLVEWGNCYVQPIILYEDDEQTRVSVLAIDLETNMAFGSEFTVSKTIERRSSDGREVVGERLNVHGDKVYIVRPTADEFRTRLNAQVSMHIRNEGLRLIPADIKIEAIETARKTLGDQYAKDPDEEKKKLIDAFTTIGIYPAQLVEYLGHGLDHITPKEIEDLRQTFVAVRDGEISWASVVGKEEGEGPDIKGQFWELLAGDLKELGYTADNVNKFIAFASEEFNLTKEAVMEGAIKAKANFLDGMTQWVAEQKHHEEEPPDDEGASIGDELGAATPDELNGLVNGAGWMPTKEVPADADLLDHIKKCKKPQMQKFAADYMTELSNNWLNINRPRAFARFMVKWEDMFDEEFGTAPAEEKLPEPLEESLEVRKQGFLAQLALFEEVMGDEEVDKELERLDVFKETCPPERFEEVITKLNTVVQEKGLSLP
jgi:hypothetical protein